MNRSYIALLLVASSLLAFGCPEKRPEGDSPNTPTKPTASSAAPAAPPAAKPAAPSGGGW